MTDQRITSSVNLSEKPTEAQAPKEEANDGKGTQTPSEQSQENGQGQNSGDENGGTGGSSEGQNQGGDDAGKDDINPDTGKPFTAAEWKEKFTQSARGVKDLLDKTQTLTSERDQEKSKVEQLAKEIEDLRKVAEGKNPEGLNLRDLQVNLEKTSKELASLKEDSLLNDFEKTTPLAATKREALRTLARANPKESLQKLWDNNLKAGAEAEDAKRKKDESDRKKGQGDKGKGTSTREPSGDSKELGGHTPEEFNKLPVAKRKEILMKQGAAV